MMYGPETYPGERSDMFWSSVAAVVFLVLWGAWATMHTSHLHTMAACASSAPGGLSQASWDACRGADARAIELP